MTIQLKNPNFVLSGVFKHHQFNKIHVSQFLAKMVNLKSCSFFDEQRALLTTDSPFANLGVKVMTYSALKVAIINSAIVSDDENVFQSSLTELKVIDKNLNPEYVIQTCPNLKKLTIDWQEEWSQPPFHKFSKLWFKKLLRNPDWRQIVSGLESLEIVFPAFYSEGGYSLPWDDLNLLCRSIRNMKKLKLTGMINYEHASIFDFLCYGNNLEELIFDNCSVLFPHPEGIPNFPPLEKLKKLHVINKNSCFCNSPHVTTCIAKMMPNLEELVLRPEQNQIGLTLNAIKELSKMKYLKRLEVAASTEDCINNMPSFIYVLREFAALRYLTLSWGSNPPEVQASRTYRMFEWLENALKADNANIHVQICHEIHSNIISNPPSLSG